MTLEMILRQDLYNCCQGQDQAQNSGLCWSSFLFLFPTYSLGEPYTMKRMSLLLPLFTPIPTNWGSPQFQILFCFVWDHQRSLLLVLCSPVNLNSWEPENYISQTPLPLVLSKCDFQFKCDFQLASEIHWHKMWKVEKRFVAIIFFWKEQRVMPCRWKVLQWSLEIYMPQAWEEIGFQALDSFQSSMTLETTT